MKSLYVIGNGFDIHHGIPSSYSNFRTWVSRENPNAFWHFVEVFGAAEDDWWNSFESSLGDVSELWHYVDDASIICDVCDRKKHPNDLNLAADEVEKDVCGVAKKFKKEFQRWAVSLPAGDSKKCIPLDENSVFLTFNYTLTLENLYGICYESILHIHGSVDDSESIIFGHGCSRKDIRACLYSHTCYEKGYEQIESDEPVDDLLFEYAQDMAAYQVYYEFGKNVRKMIEKEHVFFESLKDVEKLRIYGFSFAEIDLPYLQEIFNYVNPATLQVEVSWFTNRDKYRARRLLKTVPLQKKVKWVRLGTLCC